MVNNFINGKITFLIMFNAPGFLGFPKEAGHSEEALVVWDVIKLTTDVQLDVFPRCRWPL